MGLHGAVHSRGQLGGIEQQVDESALLLRREPDEGGLLDGPVRRLLSRGDHEITQAAPLELSGSLHHGQRLRSDARLDAGGALLGHRASSPTPSFCRASPYKSISFPPHLMNVR